MDANISATPAPTSFPLSRECTSQVRHPRQVRCQSANSGLHKSPPRTAPLLYHSSRWNDQWAWRDRLWKDAWAQGHLIVGAANQYCTGQVNNPPFGKGGSGGISGTGQDRESHCPPGKRPVLTIGEMEQGQLFSILVNSDPSRGEIPLFRKGENGLMDGQLKDPAGEPGWIDYGNTTRTVRGRPPGKVQLPTDSPGGPSSS